MAYEPPRESTEDELPESIGLRGDRYGAPTGSPSNAGNAKEANPGDYGTLPRSYLNVLTKARPETYSNEIPNASWGKTLIGLAVVTLVTFGMKIILAPSTTHNLDSLKQQLASQGAYADADPWKTFFAVLEAFSSPFVALLVPITFFAGAALLYSLARRSRNSDAGVTTGPSFMTHAYLFSLSYTPLRTVAALLNALSLVPVASCLGSLVTIGLFLFQLYSVGLSMQASQKLEPGKAQMIAFVPWIVGVLLAIFVSILVAVLVGASFLRKQ